MRSGIAGVYFTQTWPYFDHKALNPHNRRRLVGPSAAHCNVHHKMVVRNTAVSLAMALGVTATSAMEVAPDFKCCPGWKDGSLASNFTAYGAHAAGFPRTQSGRWEGFAGTCCLQCTLSVLRGNALVFGCGMASDGTSSLRMSLADVP
jgi:hypothetical protein